MFSSYFLLLKALGFLRVFLIFIVQQQGSEGTRPQSLIARRVGFLFAGMLRKRKAQNGVGRCAGGKVIPTTEDTFMTEFTRSYLRKRL